MDSSYQLSTNPQAPFLYYPQDNKFDVQFHGGFPNHQTHYTNQDFNRIMSQPLRSSPSFSSSDSTETTVPISQTYHNGYAANTPNLPTPPSVYYDSNNLPLSMPSNLLLDTKAQEPDMYYYPSTPILSASRSISSSPPDMGGLPKPATGTFVGVPKLGVDHMTESINLRRWSDIATPPVTPVYFQPNSLINHGPNSENILSAVHCSIYSPFSSPFTDCSKIPDSDYDFCDPRQLTMLPSSQLGTVTINHTMPPIPSQLSATCIDNKKQNYIAAQNISHDNGLAKYPVLPLHVHGLCNQNLMTNAEDEFVNGLVNFPTSELAQYYDPRYDRNQTGNRLTASNEGLANADVTGEFGSIETFGQAANTCPPSPPLSGSEQETKKEKPARKSKRAHSDAFPCGPGLRILKSAAQTKTESSDCTFESVGCEKSSTQPNHSCASDNKETSSIRNDDNTNKPLVTRRGRKQSMTLDPSKTYHCTQCPQRFRRHEHLRRHEKSLHSQDKPYGCEECGKKFSRSDNLAQHSRTHGSSSIQMGLRTKNELPNEPDADCDRILDLGSVLYRAAAATSGSETGQSSQRTSSGDESQARKKRKRSA